MGVSDIVIDDNVINDNSGDAPEENASAKLLGIFLIELEENASSMYPFVIVTSMYDIQFLGNIEISSYTANSTFATLLEFCRPARTVYLPVVIENNNQFALTFCKINSNGEMSIPSSHLNATLYFNGLNMNLSMNYIQPMN